MLRAKSAHRKLCIALLVVFVLSLVATSPLLAYLYRATLTVAESSGNDYTHLTVTCSEDVDWLVDNGFITTSTALDTRVETFGGSEQPHMVASDRIMTYVSALDGNSQLNWYLTTGNTELSGFPVIVGEGGYVTYGDHASLELGDDFEIEFEGFLPISDGSSLAVVGSDTSTEDSQVTSHDVNLPSGIESGDLLIMMVSVASTSENVITWPGSWTGLDQGYLFYAGSEGRAGAAYKVASGSEGSTATFTTNNAGYSAHQSYRIVGYSGVPVIGGEKSAALMISDTPDPNYYNAALGIDGRILWIAFHGRYLSSSTTISSYPSGYSDGTDVESSAGYAAVGVARKIECLSDEDAGSFTVSASVYWRTWAIAVKENTTTHLEKDGAFSIWSVDDDLYASTGKVLDQTQTICDAGYSVYGGRRRGERFNSYPDSVIGSVSFRMTKSNSPTGTGYCRVRRVSDDVIIGTLGSIDVSTISSVGEWITFDSTPVANPTVQDIRVCFEFAGGDGSNFISLCRSDTDELANAVLTTYISGWSDESGRDSTIKVFPSHGILVSSSDTPAGKSKIKLVADGTDLKLHVDDVLKDTESLGGAPIPDNSNDWVIAMTYFDYYKHTVSDTLYVHYEPITMIDGTTLPDREGAAWDGTITWGTNPSGVTATLGSLVAEESGVTIGDDDEGYREVMHEVEASDWFLEPAISTTLATHPLRPLIRIMSDNTTITELQAWRFLGLAILLLLTVSAAALVRGHLIIAGLVCGGTIALLAQQTVWPGWALVFMIPAIIAGWIAERTPSV